MTRRNNITLPDFALCMLHGPIRCTKCKAQISEQHVVAAGIRQWQDGTLCFTYDYRCSTCQTEGCVRDTTHLFTRRDWWKQLAEWYDAQSSVPLIDRHADGHQQFHRRLPRIGEMILNNDGLESISIRGGFKGDIGPIVFIYDGGDDNTSCGVLRLERNRQVRFCNLDKSYCMSTLELSQFNALADQGSFEIGGHTWIKMSTSDIKDIIADNVFGVLTDAENKDRPVTTATTKKRSAHGSTHPAKSSKRNRRPSRHPRTLDS